MAQTTSITCDCCNKELVVDSSYPHNWGLSLTPRDYGINSGGFVYAIHQSPDIDREYHFCGLPCLASWVNE